MVLAKVLMTNDLVIAFDLKLLLLHCLFFKVGLELHLENVWAPFVCFSSNCALEDSSFCCRFIWLLYPVCFNSLD